MKNYYPMKTFQEDAVVRRLNVLYKLLKDVDVEYSEAETPVPTWTFDGNMVVDGDVDIDGDVSVDQKLSAGAIESSSYGGFGSGNNGKALFVDSNGKAVPGTVAGVNHLYYHGINLYTDYTSNIHGTILNNNNVSIDSVDKFKQWIESIPNFVIFNCHGAVKYNDTIRTVISIYKNGTSNPNYGMSLQLEGSGNAFENVTGIDLADYFGNCNDAVNQLL